MLVVMTVTAAFELSVHGLACRCSAEAGTSMQLDDEAGKRLLHDSLRLARLVWMETWTEGGRFPPVVHAPAVEGW